MSSCVALLIPDILRHEDEGKAGGNGAGSCNNSHRLAAAYIRPDLARLQDLLCHLHSKEGPDVLDLVGDSGHR